MPLKTAPAFLAAAVLAAGLPTASLAGGAPRAHVPQAAPVALGREIRVGCDRSLLKRKVVFDRALGTFIDDLVALGYSNAEAVAIGERVCRDERLAGNPQAMAAQTRNILRQTPPCGCARRRH